MNKTADSPKGYRVGLDAGNLFLKLVVLDENKAVRHSSYIAHQGDAAGCARKILAAVTKQFPLQALGITGGLAPLICENLNLKPVDLVRAQISSVKQRFPRVRNILDIGGTSVGLIELDERGAFKNYTCNSLCAAGTGSFLDDQASRLEIDYGDLCEADEIKDPPPVAARCSVFAKSDLIHYQQEGYSRDQLWSGLCRGMCRTVLRTLLRGRPLSGLTAVVGGVSQNKQVLRWLRSLSPAELESFPEAHLCGAMGAAMLAERIDSSHINWSCLGDSAQASSAERRPRLELVRSRYPSFEVLESYDDALGNEVRVSFIPAEKQIRGFLGIDVGSTSTKLALVDEQGKVLIDIYRGTLGEPVNAAMKLFRALSELLRKKDKELEVLGCATTGSGRKLVGAIVGADLVINEITCHYRGARHWDPAVETIFEIGGQDSKYIFVQDGKLRQANLNYVCAAGTGSFVEELAKKLGYAVAEIGPAVMGAHPPYTSDRCTVFMEQDVSRLLRQGFSKKEVMAGVLYSVAQNYLNKVVGNRPRSRDRIFFQGATARNPGLVAAFENLLGVEVVVSPYCHILGCVGAALLARDHRRGDRPVAPAFRGLDLAERKIEIRKDECRLCENQCLITHARIEGCEEEPSFGYLCGRDPETKKRLRRDEHRLFDHRARLFKQSGRIKISNPRGKVGIPLALTAWNYLPFWQRFFAELGYEIETTEGTSAETKQKGAENTAGDFCFPVVSAYGHFLSLWEKKLDWIFIPEMISAEPNPHTTNSFFCPYVQSYPSIMRSHLRVNGRDDSRLLSAIIDLRWPERRQVKELAKKLKDKLGVSASELRRAWQRAGETLREFNAQVASENAEMLERLEREGRTGIVILGRPYNVFDTGMNLELTQKIAELGFYVLPLDALPFKPELFGSEFQNIYWSYGQRIISALLQIREHPRLFPIYFSNFNCGPDSFLLQYAEQVMGDKPMLALEFDEHGADAGYLTRVEAFLDVVKNLGQFTARTGIYLPRTDEDELKRRKIFVPPMHPIMPRLGVAAMKNFGYQAEVLPLETEESLELGRSVSRGSECLPTASTVGTLLKTLEERGEDPKKCAFFMATADGPCRFGQYALLHRMILNRKGFKEILLLSPSSINSYQGLPEDLRKRIWHCIVMGDLLFKAGCRLRPYEMNPGESDDAIEKTVRELEASLSAGKGFEKVFAQAMARLSSIAVRKEPKPLVGIVGEIYVRANLFDNDQVVRRIEEFGGEAWLSPLSEWFFYTTYMQDHRAKQDYVNFWARGESLVLNRFLSRVEERYFALAEPLLWERKEPEISEVVDAGKKYLPLNFEGEAIITVGRAIKFLDQGAQLVVNAAPFGCMPGTICNALLQEISQQNQLPIVSIFYDGKPGMNQRLRVLIENLS